MGQAMVKLSERRRYEAPTSQNAALVLVDHQVGLMTGVRDYSTGELKHNVVALAKAAKSLEVCAAFPAITAVDASGTFSETEREVGLLRMLQAGVIVSDSATLMVEILTRATGGWRSLRGHGHALGHACRSDRPRVCKIE